MFIFPAAKFRANAYVAVVLGRSGGRKSGTFQVRGVTERKNTISSCAPDAVAFNWPRDGTVCAKTAYIDT